MSKSTWERVRVCSCVHEFRHARLLVRAQSLWGKPQVKIFLVKGPVSEILQKSCIKPRHSASNEPQAKLYPTPSSTNPALHSKDHNSALVKSFALTGLLAEPRQHTTATLLVWPLKPQ